MAWMGVTGVALWDCEVFLVAVRGVAVLAVANRVAATEAAHGGCEGRGSERAHMVRRELSYCGWLVMGVSLT